MKFKSELELLKFLIKNMDDKHRCDDKILNICQYNDVQTICNYLSSLKNAGYISVYIGGVFEIHDKGISYVKHSIPVKQIFLSLIKWIVGIATAIFIAYLVFKLGLN